MYRLLALWLLLSLSACSPEPQVLVVDQAHNNFRIGGSIAPQVYRLESDTAILNLSGFDFEAVYEVERRGANYLLVYVGERNRYSLAFPRGSWSITLSPETLKPDFSAPPFRGFRSGEKVSLAIGRREGELFWESWTADVEVRLQAAEAANGTPKP